MVGNFNNSLKIAKEQYDYKSRENPGKLPHGIIVDGYKYILIPITHIAGCDSRGCRKQHQIYHRQHPNGDNYHTAPVYSKWDKCELCIVCAMNICEVKNFSEVPTFVPSKKEVRRIYIKLNDGKMDISDESSDEGDEGDECETSESEIDDVSMKKEVDETVAKETFEDMVDIVTKK